MGKVLTVDEMLEVLTIRQHPQRDAMVAAVEAVAALAASLVANEIKCDCGEAAFEPGFGGTCVSFVPAEGGPQEWPDDLGHLDADGDFEPWPLLKARLDRVVRG